MNQEQKDACKLLVILRRSARNLYRTKTLIDGNIKLFTEARDVSRKRGDRVAEAQVQVYLEEAMEFKLTVHFQRLDLGIMLIQQAPAIARTLPREVWLEVLGVNRKHWDSDDMRECGQDLCKVVGILKLENSETEETPENRPLHGCFDLALFNKIKTDPRLARTAHELADDALGGAITARFGEWKEPTTLQRLGGSSCA